MAGATESRQVKLKHTIRCSVCGGRPDGCEYEPDPEQVKQGFPSTYRICAVCQSPLLRAGRPMTHKERGKLGGLATLKKYGKGHFSEIGKRGFKKLCMKFPCNSRQKALDHLNAKGKVNRRFDRSPKGDDDAAYRAITEGMEDDYF